MPEEEVVEQPQEIEAPQVSEEEESEQLILGRFKNQDEITKAYQELEKKFTQTSQENATLRKQSEVQQLFPPQQQGQSAQVPPQQQQEVDFWADPVSAFKQVLDSELQPFYTQSYDAQKAAFANDPQFKQYEQQIDYIAKDQYPELRKQPGIVGQLYKMVRGLTFDEEAFKRQAIEEYERSKAAAAQNGIEGATASPSSLPVTQKVNLNEDEKRVAVNFYPDMRPEEAWKKYAESKIRMRG